VRSIEKVERVELVRDARFRVSIDDSTLEALKQLISAASCSLDPVTITMRRADICGFLDIELHSNHGVVAVLHVIATEVRPRFDGDEWGEFVYFGDTAVIFVISSQCFLAFDEKLHIFTREELEEKLRKFNLANLSILL
jgi:hypothetical protein